MRLLIAILSVSVITVMLVTYSSDYAVMALRKVNSLLPSSHRIVYVPKMLRTTLLPVDTKMKSQLALGDDIESFTGNVISVTDTATLKQAFIDVKAGQTVYLATGVYELNKPLSTVLDGTESNPITLTASPYSKIIVNSDVGLKIKHSHWYVRGIRFYGGCESHSLCEHAIQLVGGISNVKIAHSSFVDFNAHIKSNGIQFNKDAPRAFPRNIIITNNHFTNNSRRNTGNPVTPIDIVGGDSVQILNNFIADFAKSGGNKTTYGAFLKGGGSNGVIKGNVVACVDKLPVKHIEDIRIGLSLGGGTTGIGVCQSSDCSYEHEGGVIEGNTIINCAYDPAIFINKASHSMVKNNTLVNSCIIQVKQSSNTTLKANQILL